MLSHRTVVYIGLAVLAGCASPSPTDSALDSLTSAERAFARIASERGIRASFIANFADDGIAFDPQPYNLRQTWSLRPPAADPMAILLEWDPAAAAISRGGDFGITTGPYLLRNRGSDTPSRVGVFFSVWRRSGEGPWKGALDAGIQTPSPVTPEMLVPAPRLGPPPAAATDDQAALRRIETQPGGVTPDRYAQTFAEDARIYRDEELPIRGTHAIASALVQNGRVTFAPEAIVVAPARDLAYTYGSFTREGGKPPKRGYYVHIWTRDGHGDWRIAVAVVLDAPSS